MENHESLKVKNRWGEVYTLHPNYDEFAVIDIQGTGLPEIENSYIDSVAMDGGKHNNSRLQPRVLVIWLVIFGDNAHSRKKFYRMFPLKSEIEIYYRNSEYNVKTKAFVDSVDPVDFKGKQRFRIELTCPDPYWHGVDAVSAAVSGNPPACTIRNDSTTEIGFTAEISIETQETPTLTRTITQSETADYLRQHNLWWNWGAFNTFDRDTMSLNIYIDDEYQVPTTDYTYDLLSVVYTDLWLTFPDGKLAGGKKVTAEILVIDGETWTDLRSYTRSESKNSTLAVYSFYFYDMPESLDLTTWQMKFYLNGNEFIEGTDFVLKKNGTTLELSTSPYDGITGGHAFAFDDVVKMESFYSESNANVKEKAIAQYKSSIDPLNPFVDAVLDPDISSYDSTKDILHVDMGGKRLTDEDYELVTATSTIDSETHTILQMKNNGRISRRLTYEVISSLEGDDIRDYTESEIDDGLLLVSGLKIMNRTTGEEMSFPNVKFQNGDKFAVSTVPGNLGVVVTESEWMPAGTSLLAEAIQNGTFFKLYPGENVVQLNATSNYTFINAVFNVELLYGGV